MTSLMVNFYSYFERYDWNMSWQHPITKDTWRRAWLKQEARRFHEESVLDAERPTLDDMDFTLGLFTHFLMPMAVHIRGYPVFHASHHGIQAMVGAVANRLYGSSFIIWDHGMMWRERIKAISEITAFSLFIRNALVGLTRMSVGINYYAADAIVSCCSTGNPEWQLRLGGGVKGSVKARGMALRMTPIVNGMETDRFRPLRDLEENQPTVVMLSHVYDLKDIKNAITAAVHIVHKFKVDQYQLLIYGSIEKDPDYTKECRDMIASHGLTSNVFLMGLGAAPRVLPRGWVFLNSSKSEGLPLALGEAGLAGLPVVCTDVGGSREVVTEGSVCYGRVVPPRKPLALARAQIEVMAMLCELENVSAPTGAPRQKELQLEDFFPLNPQGFDLADRMSDMRDHRRRLGMKFRAYVLGSFSIDR
jgi:glycosyltransferase involved in cell wall biosynthesis